MFSWSRTFPRALFIWRVVFKKKKIKKNKNNAPFSALKIGVLHGSIWILIWFMKTGLFAHPY
jgi:hypothetical protein